MKKILKYMAVLAAVLLMGSCMQYDVTEVLLSRNDISLTVKGNPVFVYQSDNCQVAYNTKRNEYQAMNDDGSEYYVLRAYQTLSSLGQEFSADLRYTESGKEKSEKDLTFRIEKISNSEGLVWLWCSSDNIGLVIKVF
jgi:hypothetical protein